MSLRLDTDRRPLFDVLADVREHWYYPAESNPEHQSGSLYFGLPEEDADERDFDTEESAGAVQPS